MEHMEQENLNIASMTSKKKSFNVLKWALVFGIIIVLNLFFAYSIKLFYGKPLYTDFCTEKQVRIIPENKDECVAIGGQWTEDKYIQRELPNPGKVSIPVIETERKGYCDPDYTCRKSYEDANKLYERNVFIIWVALGVLLILGSFFLSGYEAVALGFSLGGVLSLIIGTVQFWSNMDDYLRVIVLGIALAALVWMGIKKFKD